MCSVKFYATIISVIIWVNNIICNHLKEGFESGFSLLEMLIALAIMSLTSLALFQSISTMLSVSDRAVSVTERTLEGAIAQRTVSRLIDGLVPQWSDLPEDSFSGGAHAFSAFSAGAIHLTTNENAEFTLSLLNDGEGEKSLVYKTKTENWILETGFPITAHFEYLGPENIWHEAWPIVKKPSLNEDEFLSNLRVIKLPQAIRLNSSPEHQGNYYRVGRHYFLPDRLDITRE